MAEKEVNRKQPLLNKTAVVVGGSRGIGKAVAREFVRLGGSVCIIARHLLPLEETAGELCDTLRHDSQWVEIIACDATDKERLEPELNGFAARRGAPDYLLNVVGYACPQYVQELTLKNFRDSMDVNYYGQLVPTLILLPHFLAVRRGHIAFVSSMMGYFGIMGYAAYAPTKFALAGLAEVLRHELKPYNISISVLYPPDTDTPGLEREMETKPEECALLTAGAGLLSAQEVAEVFVDGLLKKEYAILPGEAKFAWRLNKYAPSLLRRIIDRQYEQARRDVVKG